MSGHAILEIILGLAVFVGVINRGRDRELEQYRGLIPDILIGLLLLIDASLTIFPDPLPAASSDADISLSIMLFYPFACSLAGQFKGTGSWGMSPLLWLGAGLSLSILHLLSQSGFSRFGAGMEISHLAAILFLGVGAIVFSGFHRFMVVLSVSAWLLQCIIPSPEPISGIILIMGGLVFFKSGLMISIQRFRDLDFRSDDLINAYAHPFLLLDLSGRTVFANREFLLLSGFEMTKLLNREAIDLFELPDHRRLDASRRQPPGTIRCRLNMAGGDSRQILLTVSEVLKSGRKLRNLLCVVTDEEEHDLMQARIKAEARRFASLYETSRALSTSLEIRDVMAAIANAAEALTDSDSCTVFTLDHPRQMIKPIFSTEREFNKQVMGFEFPVGRGLTGIVVRDGKPRIENWDDEFGGAVLVPGTSEEGEESLLSVPLVARNVVIGALTLYKLNKKKFHDDQINTLTVFASQASAAIETSRLYMRLKESERIYKTSVNMAADSIFFVDSETGRIQDVNETGLKTFKYLKSELASRHIWELCSRSHMQYARRLWQKAVSDGHGSLSEAMCEARDESVMPVSISASRIEAGDVKFVQWVVRDISENKNLVDDMKFFRDLVSDLGEPVLVTEPMGIVCYFNAAFAKLFDIDLKTAEGSSINALSIGSQNLTALESMRSGLKGSERRTEEIAFRSEDERKIRKMVSIIPSYDEVSNLRYHIWLFSPPVGQQIEERVPAIL